MAIATSTAALIAGAAASLASTGLAVKQATKGTPSVPKPPPPPPPPPPPAAAAPPFAPDAEQGEAQGKAKRKRERQYGLDDTVLTSPLGGAQAPLGGMKTLLGG